MGQYLLCQKTAQMPYEIEEMGLHIYSAEELCYYIYHNLPMIDDSFINEALIEFIRKDLDMPVLAEKVSRCFQSSADLDSTLLVLLRNVGYYTEEEITEFQEMMIRLHRKNPLERTKDRADLLFSYRKYQNAVKAYGAIVSQGRDLRVKAGFYSEVLQHMAVCCLHLYMYPETLDCLKAAYEENKDRRILQQIYDFCVLTRQALPKDLFLDIEDEVLINWQKDYCEAQDISMQEMEHGSTAGIFSLEPEEREAALEEFLKKEKKLYREMTAE
ncbi:MAG TPA: hypothetical protein IAB48_11420 [Candidatus Fimimorpha excrementavium]|nr:hypothetical protein [Candidatus Fimimorpha excrementavium]